MLDTPQITHTTAQQTAFIHLTVPRNEIQNVMGPGISELMATVAAQGIATTGPWFTHHLEYGTQPAARPLRAIADCDTVGRWAPAGYRFRMSLTAPGQQRSRCRDNFPADPRNYRRMP